jgi:hypothetical protein
MWWRAVVGLVVAIGVFLAGRASVGDERDYAAGVRDGRALQVPPGARAAFDDGYAAGANDVFAGYDGGWDFDRPYVITLKRGDNGITYRIASRSTRPWARRAHTRRRRSDHRISVSGRRWRGRRRPATMLRRDRIRIATISETPYQGHS